MFLLDHPSHQRSSGSIVFKKKKKKATNKQNPPTIPSERNSPFSALGWEGHLNNGFPVISNLSFLWSGWWLPLDIAIRGLVLLASELAGACITVHGLSLGKAWKITMPASSLTALATGGKKSFIATQEFISTMNKEDKGVVTDNWVHKSPTTAQE